MKNIKIKIRNAGILISLLLISSCDIERLDTPPIGQTEEDWFQTEAQYREAVIGMYSYLTDWYWYRQGNFLHDMYYLPADDITEDLGGYSTFELFQGINPTNGKVTYFFDRTYKMIQRANVIIEKAESAKETGKVFNSPELIDYNLGEALFIRSLANFRLFNMYGTAPLITTRIESREAANSPKSEGTQLLDQAITDLQRAVTLLPDAWPANEKGRANKNSAYGLLQQSLLYRGDYTNNAADYTASLQAFNSINATLVSDYSDNFSIHTKNNSESLFEFQAGAPPSGLSNPWLNNDGPWRGVESMSAFWGFYTTASTPSNTSIGGSTWKVTEKLYNQFGTDPRIAFFVEDERYFTKYGKVGLDASVPDFWPGSINNPRILRYADSKLMAAEALIKSGGSKAQAIAHINDVRRRAREWGLDAGVSDGSLPADRNVNEASDEVIMQWIMDERFVELAGEENIRWFDLKRWDQSGEISLQGWGGGDQHFSTDLAATFQFEYPKHLLWPLPQDEVERNSAITENNPGY